MEEKCVCVRRLRKKWGSCNITPLVALKSPTSVIRVVVKVMVIVEIIPVRAFVEGCLMVLKLGILSVFPILELLVEVPSPRLGLKESAPIQFGAKGRKMAGGVPGADTTEVTGTVDLTMTFLAAIAADEARIVRVSVLESLFRGRAFVKTSVDGDL